MEKKRILIINCEQIISKVPGIGKVTERILNGLGIHTCEDIVSILSFNGSAFISHLKI